MGAKYPVLMGWVALFYIWMTVLVVCRRWPIYTIYRVGQNRIFTLYIWSFSCQKYRIYTVYIWFGPTLTIYTAISCFPVQTGLFLQKYMWLPSCLFKVVISLNPFGFHSAVLFGAQSCCLPPLVSARLKKQYRFLYKGVLSFLMKVCILFMNLLCLKRGGVFCSLRYDFSQPYNMYTCVYMVCIQWVVWAGESRHIQSHTGVCGGECACVNGPSQSYKRDH